MIGWICTSVTPFYDIKTKKQSFKQRPVLVIGQADSHDFAVLPISRVTNRQYLHAIYDVPVDPAAFPSSGLNQLSYVRAHKQMYVNRHALTGQVCDLKSVYPDLYLDIVIKFEDFQRKLLENII